MNFSGARVKVVFDWNILQKCLATSCSTFQSAVQEKNVDLHLRLQRLTTRIFDYQPKNGQKRKRVSKYKSSVKRATVNYFSIVFLEFCNLKWLFIAECNQSRWQIRIPCAYIRLNFDRFSSGRKCCRTEMNKLLLSHGPLTSVLTSTLVCSLVWLITADHKWYQWFCYFVTELKFRFLRFVEAISLARRSRAKWIFSSKVNLEVFLCLTFYYGNLTCHVAKIENKGNWQIGGEFTLLG